MRDGGYTATTNPLGTLVNTRSSRTDPTRGQRTVTRSAVVFKPSPLWSRYEL